MEWVEGLGAWRNTFFGAVAIGALFVGYRIDAVRPILAVVLAFGFPLVAVGMSFVQLREPPGPERLGRIALVFGGLLVVAAELTIGLVFFPPTAAGTLTLTPRAADGDIAVPDGVNDVVLQVRGQLSVHGAGEGTYQLHLTRAGGYDDNLGGKFERVIGREQRAMRRMAPTRTVTTTEVLREEIHAVGHGPLHLHLDSVDGDIRHAVRISVFRASPLLHVVPFFAAAFALGVLVIEVLFAKRGRTVPLAPGAMAAGALALYVGLRGNDPDDALSTLTGALIVSIVAGGLGGYVLSRAAIFLVGTPDTAAEGDGKPIKKRRVGK